MKEESVTDASLRQFLLGNVDDEERQRIESLFITDQLSRERVRAAEEELVDDYLEDLLSEVDKQRFRSQFAYSPDQERSLQINQLITDWAVTEGKERSSRMPPVSIWSRSFTRFRLKPMFVMPVAVAAIIAVVVSLLWLNRKIDLRNQRLSIEQEVARLNTPSGSRDVSLQMSSFSLRPLSLRSVEPEAEITIQQATQVVDFRLTRTQNGGYSSYQAVLRRVSDGESVTIRDLRGEGDGSSVHLRLPAHILNQGLYQLELTGQTADGQSSPSEEYQFEVVR